MPLFAFERVGFLWFAQKQHSRGMPDHDVGLGWLGIQIESSASMTVFAFLRAGAFVWSHNIFLSDVDSTTGYPRQRAGEPEQRLLFRFATLELREHDIHDTASGSKSSALL